MVRKLGIYPTRFRKYMYGGYIYPTRFRKYIVRWLSDIVGLGTHHVSKLPHCITSSISNAVIRERSMENMLNRLHSTYKNFDKYRIGILYHIYFIFIVIL